jgi:hypothetical protein
MTRTKTTLGSFTTGTTLWVNFNSMLTNTWKAPQAPWVHIIPCHDQVRTVPRPIYQKYTFLINVSYILWSTAQSRRRFARCLLKTFTTGTPLWVKVYLMFPHTGGTLAHRLLFSLKTTLGPFTTVQTTMTNPGRISAWCWNINSPS